MPAYRLTNFKIQKYHQNEPNRVYSRNHLSKIKNGEYIINLAEYKSIGFHQIVLYVNGNSVTCFVSFGVEHISKKILSNKNIKTNIYRI